MHRGREVTTEEMADGLRRLGIGKGDLLLVHSSLSAFGHVAGGAEAVIDALLLVAGETGTVAMPTHTWDSINAQNPVFDVRDTPSCVGFITETFRNRPRARRGLHPTHSCAAIGPRTEELLAGHETQVTPCGSKSPYQRIMDWGGKIVFLGVDLRVNTSFHALEEMACVPWVLGGFEMLYSVDAEGRQIEVPSRRHAGGLDRCFTAMEPALRDGGAVEAGRIGRAEVRVLRAGRMREIILPKLAQDPFLLLADESARRERRRFEQGQRDRMG